MASSPLYARRLGSPLSVQNKSLKVYYADGTEKGEEVEWMGMEGAMLPEVGGLVPAWIRL